MATIGYASVSGKLRRAATLLEAGQQEAAEHLYGEVLAEQPDSAMALQRLGVFALNRGQPREALSLASRWRAIEPGNALADALAGLALASLGRSEEAIIHFEAATVAHPGLLSIQKAKAAALRELGRHEEALASYESCLERDPGDAEANFERGSVLAQLKRPGQALAAFETVRKLAPGSVPAMTETGRMLLSLGRVDEAIVVYQRALGMDPRSTAACNGLGVAYREQRRFDAALECFAACLRQEPENVRALNSAGLTLHDLGRTDEAVTCLRRAIALRPQYFEALHNLGSMLCSVDRYDEAADVFSTLVALAPGFENAAGNLLRSRLACGDWRCFDADVNRVFDLIDSGADPADPLSILLVSHSPELQLTTATRHAARAQARSADSLWSGERYQHERIRIAYISADFHDHPVAHLIAGVIGKHDKTRFDTIGVSLKRELQPSAMRARLAASFGQFIDVANVDDQAVAQQLRALEVDIAVDLTGYTLGGRVGILARRPAPVQVNFLGFPGSLGAAFADYLIADAVVIPRDQSHHYCERIVRLPPSCLPHDDSQYVAGSGATRHELGLPVDAFVFCAFNNIAKMNPATFDVWMRLLSALPQAVLWLRSGHPAAEANLRREASLRGISARRLLFAPRVEDMGMHLARYRSADLFLDTLPYGAHATAHDALFAGLPVLTCMGATFAGRVCASLLTAVDLPQLIATNLEEYFAIALQLALAPARLAELRDQLARANPGSALFDTARYCRNLETAYTSMWERTQRGEAPVDMDVCARPITAC